MTSSLRFVLFLLIAAVFVPLLSTCSIVPSYWVEFETDAVVRDVCLREAAKVELGASGIELTDSRKIAEQFGMAHGDYRFVLPAESVPSGVIPGARIFFKDKYSMRLQIGFISTGGIENQSKATLFELRQQIKPLMSGIDRLALALQQKCGARAIKGSESITCQSALCERD